MRAVFVGTSELTIRTAQLLVDRGYDVVIVESDRGRIDELTEQMDVAFLHGDGSKPAILREASPSQAEFLFCLTNDDRTNIIASLVGRSLGFQRVVTSIEDPDFEPICSELGLHDVIIPVRTIGRYLADVTRGIDILELSTAIKGEARFFAFTLGDDSVRHVSDLQLPDEAHVVCLYRGDDMLFVDGHTRLQQGDEVVVLTHSSQLPLLRERWQPKSLPSVGDADASSDAD